MHRAARGGVARALCGLVPLAVSLACQRPPPSASPVASLAAPDAAPYWDPNRPVPERVRDLVGRMTLPEKISQMMDKAPAIERLGVPAYGWWNEALHGVARAGTATVFPQAIGLAATFDEALMGEVARVIADEARAKHHEAARAGERGRYQGLTFFSPNINLFRDPRWGRGHETYGEDPFLTSRLAVAFIQGLQGDHPQYLKVAATAKHFAVHSGPEKERHRFDARPSVHDLYDTYLPPFEASVREAKVESVMSAYNSVNGQAASANPWLLGAVLRGAWGFQGYVVSDCWAVKDIWESHHQAKDAAEASALAVHAGTDLECGSDFEHLGAALEREQLREAELDQALYRLFSVRFRLGLFDPADRVPYAQIPFSVNDAPAHRALALRAAEKSLVLLENRGVLPLSSKTKKLAVIGPTAALGDVLLGNYHGTPSRQVTLLDGLKAAAEARGIELRSAEGSKVVEKIAGGVARAAELAAWADTVVLTLGITPHQEGEENESRFNADGDRLDIALPKPQRALFEAVRKRARKTVVVLTGGSSLALPKIQSQAGAVLLAWYPGEEGGTAVARALFGEFSPGGRLPVTFYKATRDLPPFADYSMAGRTYRYFEGTPLWPFGHGLSYAQFKYSAMDVAPKAPKVGEGVVVSAQLTNTGAVAGDEVIQLYVRHDESAEPVPRRWLAGVQRLHLKPGESRAVRFELQPRALSVVTQSGDRALEPGRLVLAIGGGQPGANHQYPSEAQGLTSTLAVQGERHILSRPIASAPRPPQ